MPSRMSSGAGPLVYFEHLTEQTIMANYVTAQEKNVRFKMVGTQKRRSIRTRCSRVRTFAHAPRRRCANSLATKRRQRGFFKIARAGEIDLLRRLSPRCYFTRTRRRGKFALVRSRCKALRLALTSTSMFQKAGLVSGPFFCIRTK